MTKVDIYTNGSHLGCWASILKSGNSMGEVSGSEESSSAYRMEIMACVRGLQALTRPCSVRIFVFNSTVHGVMEKRFCRRKEVDLLRELDDLCCRHESVQFMTVKNGNGDEDSLRALRKLLRSERNKVLTIQE